MAMAVLHVVGALGLTFAFGLLVLLIGVWEQERVQRRRLQDASIALGVPLASSSQARGISKRLNADGLAPLRPPYWQ